MTAGWFSGRLAREVGRVVCLASMVAILAFAGCGSAIKLSSPSLTSDPVEAETKQLRERQLKMLYSFDSMVASSDSVKVCESLCNHHTRICALATRICAIAKKHPTHSRAAAACQSANQTCRDTTTRIPDECWCK